jgi:uncharacterized protein (DUF2252 family)
MLQSPFTFYRGAALNMAADLASTPATGLRVQACGDCHLLNFGAFATSERRVIFDIHDLDEALADRAIADFPSAYADQSERDHDTLVKAVRAGELEVFIERD